jgi:hypothetical protein
MEKTESFIAGEEAAKNGTNINNSYPYKHEEFVAGYKSVKANAKEDLQMKALAKKIAPEEYDLL